MQCMNNESVSKGSPKVLINLSHSSLLYIEEDLLSEVGKGHKSEGDSQEQNPAAQVRCLLV